MPCTAPQVHFLAVPQCSSWYRDGNTTTATYCNTAAVVDYERIYREAETNFFYWPYLTLLQHCNSPQHKCSVVLKDLNASITWPYFIEWCRRTLVFSTCVKPRTAFAGAFVWGKLRTISTDETAAILNTPLLYSYCSTVKHDGNCWLTAVILTSGASRFEDNLLEAIHQHTWPCYPN